MIFVKYKLSIKYGKWYKLNCNYKENLFMNNFIFGIKFIVL